MNLSFLLKISSVLWVVWGIFHLILGIALIYLLFLGNEALSIEAIASDPLMLGTLTEYAPVITANLKQHSWNLAWFGLVTTIGGVYIYKKSKIAIFFCALVGGLADFGYLIFVDLHGLAPPVGTAMTFISGGAIILSFYAYFKSDRLQAI